MILTFRFDGAGYLQKEGAKQQVFVLPVDAVAHLVK